MRFRELVDAPGQANCNTVALKTGDRCRRDTDLAHLAGANQSFGAKLSYGTFSLGGWRPMRQNDTKPRMRLHIIRGFVSFQSESRTHIGEVR